MAQETALETEASGGNGGGELSVTSTDLFPSEGRRKERATSMQQALRPIKKRMRRHNSDSPVMSHSTSMTHQSSMGSGLARERSQAAMAREYRMEMYRKILGADHHRAGFCATLCDRSTDTGYWVDSNQFKVVICVLVIANAVYVGVTAVDEELENHASLALLCCEMFFLISFSSELVLRLTARGLCVFLKDGWSYFDVLLVLANALEVMATLIQIANVGSLQTAAAVLRVTRVMRLMRVFQIVRLFRFVDELHLLLKGMVSAVRTLVWSMGMLFAVIYICSLVVTKYLGQSSQNEMTRYYFGNLGRSMFTLFTFVTLEGWPNVARHLMDTEEFGGVIVIVLILYILFTNLALMNLVTAVLVDSVVNISNSDDKKRMERFDRQRKETVRRLQQVFMRIDEDNNGELSFQEFQDGVTKSKEVREMMQSLQIAVEDAEELFHLIDFDENGKISTMEFIEGAIMCKAGDAVSRHLLSFHYDVRKYFSVLGEVQESILDMLSKNSDVEEVSVERSSFMLPKPRGSIPALVRQISESGPTTPLDTAVSSSTLAGARSALGDGERHPDRRKSGEIAPLPKSTARRGRTESAPGREPTYGVQHASHSGGAERSCSLWTPPKNGDSRSALSLQSSGPCGHQAGAAAECRGLPGMEARLRELLQAMEERVSTSQRQAMERMEQRMLAALQQQRQEWRSGTASRSPSATAHVSYPSCSPGASRPCSALAREAPLPVSSAGAREPLSPEHMASEPFLLARSGPLQASSRQLSREPPEHAVPAAEASEQTPPPVPAQPPQASTAEPASLPGLVHEPSGFREAERDQDVPQSVCSLHVPQGLHAEPAGCLSDLSLIEAQAPMPAGSLPSPPPAPQGTPPRQPVQPTSPERPRVGRAGSIACEQALVGGRRREALRSPQANREATSPPLVLRDASSPATCIEAQSPILVLAARALASWPAAELKGPRPITWEDWAHPLQPP